MCDLNKSTDSDTRSLEIENEELRRKNEEL